VSSTDLDSAPAQLPAAQREAVEVAGLG
jgi:hypothetical protein